MRSLGIAVFDTPAGFREVDNITLVYAPHFSTEHWPGSVPDEEALITVSVDVEKPQLSSGKWIASSAASRQKFLGARGRLKWPEPEGTHLPVMNDMVLYWKMEQSDDYIG